MPEERRVFTFEPGSGFTQVDDTPIVSREDKPTEKIPVEQPVSEQEVPQPPVSEETPPTVPPVEETPPVEEEVPVPDEQVPPISAEEDETVPPQEQEVETPPTVPPSTDETEVPPTEEQPPVEIPETDNFFKVAAARLKASGALPEEFELDENLSEDQADQAIYDAYINKMKPEADKELLSEFQSEMQKRGWNEQTLQYASLLQSGVRPEEISQMQDYKTLANVDTAKLDDEGKENYIRQMYQDRGWKEKEIKRVIDSAEVDDDLDGLVSESVNYFQNRDKEFEAEKVQIAKANQEQQDRISQYRQSVVADIFNKKQLGDDKFTEEQLDAFEDALYQRSVPVQVEGQIYNLTPYEQFDAALNQDFALRLWAFKKWMFREQEAETYRQEAEKQAEESRIMKWGKRTKKVEGAPEVPPTEQKEVITNNRITSASKTGGDSYVFEGGEFKQIPKKK